MSVVIDDFTEDQKALYDLMSDLSEEHYFAGWIYGCEDWLWNQLMGIDSGNYNITNAQKAKLTRAAHKAGGWIIWNDEIDEPEFLNFNEWAKKSNGSILPNCNQCSHTDTCKNKAPTVSGIPLPPLSQRGDKPSCWVCSCCYWRSMVSGGYRECDVCRTVKNLNDESVKIQHTRG